MGAALLGFQAPFRLVQDHSRSGRLEAPSQALKSWLFSDKFAHYLTLVQVRGLCLLSVSRPSLRPEKHIVATEP